MDGRPSGGLQSCEIIGMVCGERLGEVRAAVPILKHAVMYLPFRLCGFDIH